LERNTLKENANTGVQKIFNFVASGKTYVRGHLAGENVKQVEETLRRDFASTIEDFEIIQITEMSAEEYAELGFSESGMILKH
jgi:uncharacterized protein YeeX (DUF496 family)